MDICIVIGRWHTLIWTHAQPSSKPRAMHTLSYICILSTHSQLDSHTQPSTSVATHTQLDSRPALHQCHSRRITPSRAATPVPRTSPPHSRWGSTGCRWRRRPTKIRPPWPPLPRALRIDKHFSSFTSPNAIDIKWDDSSVCEVSSGVTRVYVSWVNSSGFWDKRLKVPAGNIMLL